MKNKFLLLTLITLLFISCSEESSEPLSKDITTEMSKINSYFQENLPGHITILVGKDETLISDLN